ncbi:MAG: N-acetylneuraminate synthase family protein [Deltaproteobacteria bacterium]|nr:N-acetylneuraminate synthase family protein [Deltaproteobacteria bacterium]
MNRFPPHIQIDGRRIGPGFPCYIIAEGGVNHFGDRKKAIRLVDMAVAAKADAFKTQHFKTDRLVGSSAPEWRERLRSKELPDDAMKELQRECQRRSITFLCTPHDEIALDFITEALKVPAIKVGSGEVENWSFLKKIARSGRPVILSTGMYELFQVKEAIQVLEDNGCNELAVLHCVTEYPADPADINLKVMDQIRSFFPGPVGYSDHTAGTAVPLAAVALGADIIEKHITLDRNVPNAHDWKVSCGPENFHRFVMDIRDVEKALGGHGKTLSANERKSMQWARKSLVLIRDVSPGDVLTEEMLIAQRPGDGIPPSRIDSVAGKRAKRFLPSGTVIKMEDLSGEMSSE